jgi:hypothetical protein
MGPPYTRVPMSHKHEARALILSDIVENKAWLRLLAIHLYKFQKTSRENRNVVFYIVENIVNHDVLLISCHRHRCSHSTMFRLFQHSATKPSSFARFSTTTCMLLYQ